MPINISGTMLNIMHAMTARNTKETAKATQGNTDDLRRIAAIQTKGRSSEKVDQLTQDYYRQYHPTDFYNAMKAAEALKNMSSNVDAKKMQRSLRDEYKKQGGGLNG